MTDEWLGMTKWAIVAIIAAVLGLFSKGPGIVLVAALYPLFVWGVYQRYTLDSRFRGNDKTEEEEKDKARFLDYARDDREAGRDDRKGARDDKVRKFFAYLGIATIALVGFGLLAVPKTYLNSITNATALSKFDSPLESIGKYLDKTMDMGELRDSSLSYWGNFGWLDTPISGWMLSVINWIEIVGFVSVLVYLLVPVLKKKNWIPAGRLSADWRTGMTEKTDDKIGTRSLDYARDDEERHGNDRGGDDGMGWVPERKYLVFFLGMIILLQFAIRFYDWRVFDATGQVLIGQPGRYFLPNLIGHLVLVVVGVGFVVSWVKEKTGFFASLRMTEETRSLDYARDDREKDFEMILKILALAMILLQLHAIVNVIIPRYYL